MRAFKSFATKMLFGIAATGIILTSTACAEEIPDEYFEEEVDAVDVFEEPEVISDILPEEEPIQEEVFGEEEYLVGDEEPAETNIVASGNCGTPTWVLYDDGTLVISGSGTIMADPVVHKSYWEHYPVKKVQIENGITVM